VIGIFVIYDKLGSGGSISHLSPSAMSLSHGKSISGSSGSTPTIVTSIPSGSSTEQIHTYKQGGLVCLLTQLVAKGYSQILGIDYMDVFSPVVCLATICTLLALAAVEDWEIQQMDVKGAYLNGNLKEEIYMMQPEGYGDGSDKACQLLKTLYGLKQSGHEWNIEFNIKLEKCGYKRIHSDPCVYILWTSDGMVLITVWVDNLLIFTTSIKYMEIAKHDISESFKVTDLGC